MIALYLLIGYLIGSIPFALIVGKCMYQKDIRTEGSRNLGATNTFRVLGKKAGTIVLLGDFLKGTFAASIPFLFDLPISGLWMGVFAVIGHCYPVFAKFKGGKAVATSAGVILFLDPSVFLCALLVFLVILYIGRMVSLASMVASIVTVFYSYLYSSTEMLYMTLILSMLIIYRHRTNVLRILKKEEVKVKFFKNN